MTHPRKSERPQDHVLWPDFQAFALHRGLSTTDEREWFWITYWDWFVAGAKVGAQKTIDKMVSDQQGLSTGRVVWDSSDPPS